MEKEKSIRSIGAEFLMTNELPEGSYELSFIARCREVGNDQDDRAVYGSSSKKTLIAASQLSRPYGLKEGDDFPEKIKFDVDQKHRIIF